mgnify:CR=1 FL=1
MYFKDAPEPCPAMFILLFLTITSIPAEAVTNNMFPADEVWKKSNSAPGFIEPVAIEQVRFPPTIL